MSGEEIANKDDSDFLPGLDEAATVSGDKGPIGDAPEQAPRAHKIKYPKRVDGRRSRVANRAYFPLSLLAGLLGLISLSFPWVFEYSSFRYVGLYQAFNIFSYALMGDFNLAYSVIIFLILTGSIICFVSPLGGVLQLSGIVLYATQFPQGADLFGPGPFVAVAAAFLGMTSLILRTRIFIPERFATLSFGADGRLSVNVLAIVAFGLGLASVFACWFTTEYDFRGQPSFYESNYSLLSFIFSVHFSDVTLMIVAATLIAVGSIVCILTPLGSALQLSGIVLFFMEYRSEIAGYDSDYSRQSAALGVGLYICILAAAAGIYSMMYVRRVTLPKSCSSDMLVRNAAPFVQTSFLPDDHSGASKPSRLSRMLGRMPKAARLPAVLSIGIAVMIVILAIPYAASVSSVEMHIMNNFIEDVEIDVYIDGAYTGSGMATSFQQFIDKCNIKAGAHSIAIDYAFSGDDDPNPDGSMDWASSFIAEPYTRFIISIALKGYFDTSLPRVQISSTETADGFMLTFDEIISYTVYGERIDDILWTDVSLLLFDGTDSAKWSPQTGDLDDVYMSIHDYGLLSLNGSEINCMVSDLAGNGYANVGDYFELTIVSGALDSNVDYIAYILNDSTSSMIGQVSLQS